MIFGLWSFGPVYVLTLIHQWIRFSKIIAILKHSYFLNRMYRQPLCGMSKSKVVKVCESGDDSLML